LSPPTFEVGLSMFDVHFFSVNLPQSIRRKNNSVLMGFMVNSPTIFSYF
jgi:hypothetical protein